MNKKLSLFGLIGITMAFFGTVRSVPTLASTGWAQIFYMLIAACCFALPIALISAELSTGWPEEGDLKFGYVMLLVKNGALLLHGYYGYKCFSEWLWLHQLSVYYLDMLSTVQTLDTTIYLFLL